MSLASRSTASILALVTLLASVLVVQPQPAEAIVTASPADIMFVIDESGSMGDDQRAVRDNVDYIAEQVAAAVDARFGLVGFGANSSHGTSGGRGHLHTSSLTDRDGLASALGELIASGGTEPGVEATLTGLRDMDGFRSGATTCVVLITDEDNDDPTPLAEAHQALVERNGVFLAVGTASGNYASTYGQLVGETGTFESIAAFRSDPTRVLGAILESCADTAAVPPGSENFGDRPWQGHWGDPISLASGNFYGTWEDLEFPAEVFGMDVSRSYNSQDAAVGPMGRGWVAPFAEDALLLPSGDMVVLEPDGRRLRFETNDDGTFTTPPTVHAELVATTGGFELRYVNGETWVLAADGQLQSRSDWTGQVVTYDRDAEGRVVDVSSTTGYALTLAYDADGQLVEVASSDGRTVAYAYDDGALDAVTLPDGGVQTWQTDAEDRVIEIRDPDGTLVLANTYDEFGRVVSQLDPAEGESLLSYDGNTTTVEDLRTGETLTYVHDANGMLDEVVDPTGATVDYDYDTDGNLVAVTDRRGATTTQTFDGNGMLLSSSDPSGDTVSFTYDDQGRMTSRTDAAGSTWTMTYEADERIPSQVVGPDGATTEVDVVDGLITVITDADGVTDTFTYDTARNLVAATNGVGDTTSFNYDAAGRLVEIVLPSGATTQLTVDERGRVTSETDAVGATTTTEFTQGGLVSAVVDPTGARTEMRYDDAGRLVELVDAHGEVTTYAYDAASRLTEMTEPGGATTSYSYGPLGRLEEVTDPEGGVTTFGHDVDGAATEVTSPTGDVTTRDFDLEGRLVAETDPEGNTTTFTYDELDRLVAVGHPDGTSEQIDHDAYGRVTELVDQLGAAETRGYTAAGRLAEIVDPVGDVTSFAYDAAGRLAAVTDGEGGTTEIAYTPDGDVASETSPSGLTTSYAYDPAGRLTAVTDPGGDTTTAEYTLRGELERLVDPTGAVTEYAYDALGRLVRSVDPNGGTTTYDHDARGNRISRTNALGHTETWSYDLADRLVASVDQLGNATTASYDAAGRLVEVADPTGRVEQLAYDGRGLLTTQTYADGTTIEHAYDALGRRTSMTDPTGTTTWDHDAVGNLTEVTTPNGDVVRYAYDAARRRTATTYPDGRTVTTGYDGRGLPVLVDDPDHGITRLEYDADGRVVAEDLPDGLREFAYDDAGELSSFVQKVDGRDEVETLTWDAAGRLASRTNGQQTADYTYDTAGQLLDVAIDGGLATGTGAGADDLLDQPPITVSEGAYAYDAAGNRTAAHEPGTRDTTAEFDAAGRLVSTTDGDGRVTSYEYDAAGRRVAEHGPDESVAYTYDARGVLTEIHRTNDDGRTSVERRTVDGDGRLTQTSLVDGKTSKSTGYVWDQASAVEQVLELDRSVDASGRQHDRDDEIDLTYVGDRRLGFVSDDGTSGSFATDPLGNAIETPGTTDLVEASIYTPYGAPVEATGTTRDETVAGTFGFRGELATSVGLHLRAREYDTATGQFLTVDPLDGLPGMTVETSAYHYANNDPVNYIDPLGLSAVEDCVFRVEIACFGGPTIGPQTISGAQNYWCAPVCSALRVSGANGASAGLSFIDGVLDFSVARASRLAALDRIIPTLRGRPGQRAALVEAFRLRTSRLTLGPVGVRSSAVIRLGGSPLVRTMSRVLGPVGAVLTFGAELAEVDENDPTQTQSVGDALVETGSSVAGGFAGAKAGAALGAAVGSVVPGVGTAAGALVGGIAGAIGGGLVGGSIGEWLT